VTQDVDVKLASQLLDAKERSEKSRFDEEMGGLDQMQAKQVRLGVTRSCSISGHEVSPAW
jgi:hypothetical protein